MFNYYNIVMSNINSDLPTRTSNCHTKQSLHLKLNTFVIPASGQGD